MSQREFLRARRPEQKEERRATILAAARELAARNGVRNVSLGSVAAAVCLAKSNVSRYFGTREEIYLEMVVHDVRDWADDVIERLKDATGRADVLTILVESFQVRPLFCDLLSHCTTTLEHNVALGPLRTFKVTMHETFPEVGAAVAKVDQELTDAEATELVTAALGLATLLYPLVTPPPVLVELYATEPGLTKPDFATTMRRMLAAAAAGLPTLRP